MAVSELPRPGIEVLQVFRTTSPTILNPTLAPVIVGVCRQVVDVVSGGVINSQALVSLPAIMKAKDATGPTYKYTGLDGLTLVVSVNYGPSVTTTFAGTSLAPKDIVTQVNKALKDAAVDSAVAEVVGNGWRLRTLAVGDTAHIKVVSGTAGVLTAFGLAADLQFFGFSNYAQDGFFVPSTNFPDPNGNLTELGIEPSTVKVYLGLGTGASMREVRRTSAFLRRSGTAVKAVLTGTITLSGFTFSTLNNTTMLLSIDGAANVTVTFDASVADAPEVVATINAACGATIASVVGNFLTLTSTTAGPSSSVKVVSGSAVTLLGFTAGQTDVGEATIQAIDDGNGDGLTPLLAVYDQAGAVDLTSTTTVPTVAVVTASAVPDLVNIDNKTLVISDGKHVKTVEFGTVTLLTDIITAINAAFDQTDGITASDAGGGILRLTATTKREDGATDAKGADSTIVILGGTAVNGASNYLDTGGTPTLKIGRYEGLPYAVAVGDELWIDGKYAGKVVQVAPGGQKNVIKLDKQFATTYAATTGWYIDAKNLTEGGGAYTTRPRPELIVDGTGSASAKAMLLRDAYGKPSESIVTSGGVSVLIPTKSLVYLGYKAVRKDVSAMAKKPGVLAFTDTTQLASLVPPVSVDSPMSLGTFFALLNAPGSQVNALGVDEVSAGAPYGTVEAFTRAFEYLEAVEVYAIAPMTNDATVGQIALSHVAAMSLPESKGERIAIFNSKTPTETVDTLVASGTAGSGTPDPTQFDTGIANLSALLIAQGLDPSGALDVSDALFLDIATDTKKYSVKAVSGSIITVRTTGGEFLAGENDDDYYTETTLPAGLINEPFALRIRGASLTLADGSKDKTSMAATMQAIGKGYANRRFWNVVPDKCAATLSGLEQEIDGFYMAAAIAGMIAQQPPQQSFTNFPMNGFTRVIGSNDFFTEKQLNVIAAGGNWIVIQEGVGTPLFSRMALTTDLTSIETRTDSITKVVDFVAKFLRTGLKNFIGRFNVTQGFLDSLGHVVQGLGTFLMDTGVLIGFTMNNIIQDADAPDTVLIDCTLDVPFPCNYIRLTLVI